MKKTSLIFILIILFGCTHKTTLDKEKENTDNEDYICGNATSKPVNELERLVLIGDTNAYDEL
jgi:hypothetical protein